MTDDLLQLAREAGVSVEHPEDFAAVLRAMRLTQQRTIERCAEACCEVNNRRKSRGMNQGFNAIMECVDAIRALGAK